MSIENHDAEDPLTTYIRKDFIPDRKLAVICLVESYDKVWAKKDGVVYQAKENTDPIAVKGFHRLVDMLHRF